MHAQSSITACRKLSRVLAIAQVPNVVSALRRK